MKRVLLLNSTYVPLNFITVERAIRLLLKSRVEIVVLGDGNPSTWDEKWSTTRLSFDVPATLRLLNRASFQKKSPRFRKLALFNRDGWRCQYCDKCLSKDTATVDHVMPSSRGGKTSWHNCVAACKPCNKKKANNTPEEAKMRLLKQPSDPLPTHFWEVSCWHPDWEFFMV